MDTTNDDECQEKSAPVQTLEEKVNEEETEIIEQPIASSSTAAEAGGPSLNGIAKEKVGENSFHGGVERASSDASYLLSSVRIENGEQIPREPSQFALVRSPPEAHTGEAPQLPVPSGRGQRRGTQMLSNTRKSLTPQGTMSTGRDQRRRAPQSSSKTGTSMGGDTLRVSARQSPVPSSLPPSQSKDAAQIKASCVSRRSTTGRASIGSEHSSGSGQAEHQGKEASQTVLSSMPGAFVVDHELNVVEQRSSLMKGASSTPQTLDERDVESSGSSPGESDRTLDEKALPEKAAPDGELSPMQSEDPKAPTPLFWCSTVRGKVFAATCAVLILVIAVAVAVPLALSRSSPQSSSDDGPQPQDEPGSTVSGEESNESFLAMKLLLAPISGEEVLNDETSPQHAALRWLVHDDKYPQVDPNDDSAVWMLEQRFVLASLYYSMAGDQWLSSEGWLGPADVCTWEYLQCDGASNVISIEAHESFLMGPIPDELAFLSSLNQLSLHGNRGIVGTLPVSLFELESLEILYLSNCALEGVISSQIARLTSLRELSMFNNNFSGTVPPEIGNLSGLVYLDVNGNNLEGEVPETIARLTGVEILHLGGNRFTGSIPPQLDSMEKLRELWLHDNSLSGTIPRFGSLANLEHLRLEGQKLSGPLPDFSNLVSLTEMRLDGNEINGTIPASLGQLTNLTELSLDRNLLSGEVPAELGNLQGLRSLNLGYNPDMEGAVPPELCDLNLELLVVDCNIRCKCCNYCN